MNAHDIFGLLIVLGVVVIPSLGLTARFALKPIVEAIRRLKEPIGSSAATPQLETRLDAVEAELRELRELRPLVERVVAAVEFDAQLRASATGDVPRLPQA